MKNDKKAPVKKYSRFFSLITYASEKQIMRVVALHSRSIRAHAYIYHNRDENEPHFHIVLRTYSSWSVNQIQKWFSGLKDEKAQNINTFVEVAHDTIALETYLTHSDEESIEEGKAPYNKNEIHDFGLWDIVPKKDSYDDSYDIINDIHVGMSVRDLVRRYGRDYIYHRMAYHEVSRAIEIEECHNFHNDAQTQALARRTSLVEVDPNTFEIEKEFRK